MITNDLDTTSDTTSSSVAADVLGNAMTSGCPDCQEEKPKKKRGFALMDPEKVKYYASLGGKKANEMGTSHKWTSEKAREAGRLGGLKSQEKRRQGKVI